MKRRIAALADALAAEFALGTLRGPARRRFEELARTDAALSAAKRRWEAALAPLVAGVAPVEPPARVWRAIEERIDRTRGAAPEAQGTAFWRALGLLAGGLATVLLAAFLFLGPAREAEPLFVAVLTAPDSAPRMMVTLRAPGELRVRPIKPWKGIEGKGLELWVMPGEGAPRSLGLVRNDADTRIRIDPADPRMQGAKTLLVSLEPASGSPTGQPTGPVLCSGAVAATRS